MYVIGTAGHVDHGKSTLIKALTNIDPDRLPEEKDRGMTIDLGFAWLTLPSGREVSIVDVPGHERFVTNMLTGVGGMDLAMLVVAADESVMPQTREHLNILDIVRVKRGLVVITKSDLVDEELLELVKIEVEDALKGTSFEESSILAVSASKGEGLEELMGTLDTMLEATQARPDIGRPRLPVDRCFSVAGFGTVVTGTLIDGTISIGQEVELIPSGQRGRVRGLQSHHQKVEVADPGRRLAVNLSGVSHDQIERGEVVTIPGWLRPTTMLDARIRVIRDAPRPLKHNEGVTFHAFTSETTARIRLLDARELKPGEEGWAQIHLRQPIPIVKGDFFVVRSPETTLGGGKVVDPYPRRHRLFQQPVLTRLAAVEEGSAEELILNAVEQWGPCDLNTLTRRANLSLEEAQATAEELTQSQRIVFLGNSATDRETFFYSLGAWKSLKEKASSALESYHRQHPLHKGISREELRSRLGLSQQIFSRTLVRLTEEGVLTEEGPWVRQPHHKVTFTPIQEKGASAYLQALESEPFSPPTDQPVDGEFLAALIEEGRVVKVNESVVFAAKEYQKMVEKIETHIKEHGNITVAEARSLLNSSRKYVLPLLEYLDQQHITRRVGDERVLR